jgi:hypothetical protein
MSFLDKLQRTIQSANKEWKKPESFAKGEAFEKYLENYTFPKSDYELIYRTSSYTDNRDNYATATKLPDFRFMCKKTGQHFYVEAKFRNGEFWKDNKLEWTYPSQLDRYKQVDIHDAPVFVALGIGDRGDYPEFLFLIPLNKVNYCGFYESVLAKYEFYLDRPVFSSYLWNLRR